MYYKRANDRRWKVPASVLGQDGQQVLVKHGSHYICVHPCRLTLERTPITIQSKNESTQETQQHQQQQYNRKDNIQHMTQTQKKKPSQTAQKIQTHHNELKMICII